MAGHRSSSSSKGKFSRRVAPFVPLALALAMHPAITGFLGGRAAENEVSAGDLAMVQCEDAEDSAQCHAKYRSGCNTSSGEYDPYLNFLKNTIDFPASAAPASFFDSLAQVRDKEKQLQDKQTELGETLTTHNHHDFQEPFKQLGEGSMQGVIGYLYGVTVETGGKGETSNCKLHTNEEDVDYHIFVGFDASTAAKIRKKSNSATLADKGKSIVVEMTPHYRAAFHPEWTGDVVKSALGKKVKVVGQLMVDNDHNNKGDDCGFSGASSGCWRASIWELHPVTQFQVCNSPSNDCDLNSANWVDLQSP